MPYTPNPTDITQPDLSKAVASAAEEFRKIKEYLQGIGVNPEALQNLLASPNGAGMIGFGAQTVATALTPVDTLTVTVPTDYPTLQAAFDALHDTVRTGKAIVTVNIAASHQLTAPLLLQHGDYSNFRITSTDAQVFVYATVVGIADAVAAWGEDMNAPGGTSPYKAFICLRNAKGPRLATVINCNGHTGFDHGIAIMHQSSMIIEPNCGIINSSGRNLFVLSSLLDCRYGKHSGAAREGLRARQSHVVFADADFSNCGDSTDPAIFLSRGTTFYGNRADISNAGGNGLVVHRSWGSAEDCDISGAGLIAAQIDLSSHVSIAGSDLSLSGSYALQCARSVVDARNTILTGANSGGQAFNIIFGGYLTAENYTSAVDVFSIANTPPNLITADGVFITSKTPVYSPLRQMGRFSATGASNGKTFSSASILDSSRDTADAQFHQRFYNLNGLVGSIQTLGSATLYNTSSDYRLKTNVADYTVSGIIIDKLRPRAFNWKADGAADVGFLAHEVQEVVPQAVCGVKDGEQMQGGDWTKLVPYLVAEIKSLRARVADLERK